MTYNLDDFRPTLRLPTSVKFSKDMLWKDKLRCILFDYLRHSISESAGVEQGRRLFFVFVFVLCFLLVSYTTWYLVLPENHTGPCPKCSVDYYYFSIYCTSLHHSGWWENSFRGKGSRLNLVFWLLVHNFRSLQTINSCHIRPGPSAAEMHVSNKWVYTRESLVSK